MTIKVGTAGWAIPRDVAEQFPAEGSSLERYAARFTIAEINSSFHRPHRLSTWERWHDSVPDEFRFSVKLPNAITHQCKLQDCGEEIDRFVEQLQPLRMKLAVLLVQLPPKLAFEESVATDFFEVLTSLSAANVVCEPRHPSWFTQAADELLSKQGVARVAADPSICPGAASPGGWSGFRYWRLHGSPRMYRSSYEDRIDPYAAQLLEEAAGGAEVWCIFDNTASSAAAGDALALMDAVENGGAEGFEQRL